MLVNTDVHETTEEGGLVLVTVERLVISDGVVPLLATMGGFWPGMTEADQLNMSWGRTPPI